MLLQKSMHFHSILVPKSDAASNCTSLPALRSTEATEAVDEFRQTDCGERCILVTSRVYDSLDELLDRIPTALGSDDHAGVEDQSPAGGFSGSRWLLMTSSRSQAKSPSSVAVEPCSLARRSDSDSNRT